MPDNEPKHLMGSVYLYLLITLQLNYLKSLHSYVKAYWFLLKTINGIHICLYIFLTINNHKNWNNSITLFLFSPIVKSQWAAFWISLRRLRIILRLKIKHIFLHIFICFLSNKISFIETLHKALFLFSLNCLFIYIKNFPVELYYRRLNLFNCSKYDLHFYKRNT